MRIKIKIDPADIAFSLYVRKRDKNTCVKCHRVFGIEEKGLSCSHYFGRGKESVRFDLDNCDSLCYPGCHLYWQNEDRESYRAFKIKQLGQSGFDALMVRAYQTVKKDRKMQRIIWEKALKEKLYS